MIEYLFALILLLTTALLSVDDHAWAAAVGAVTFVFSFAAIFGLIGLVAGSLGYLAGLVLG